MKKKHNIDTIHEKNSVMENIILAMIERKNFLVLGHKNEDEDCLGSMAAFSLLLSKFGKEVSIYIGSTIHEHYRFLIDICEYNAIHYLKTDDRLQDGIDTVVICDTPKPVMIDLPPEGKALMDNRDIVKIEIDHHLGGDSTYIGDEGYCLVTEASSSCELVGLVALKLKKKKDILEHYNIADPMTRNLVLCILTGIIGDTNMGQFLKSRRERVYYNLYSGLYNKLLIKDTFKAKNFTDKEQVYKELQRLSRSESQCYDYFLERKRMTRSIGYVLLDEAEMKEVRDKFDQETVVTVSRTIADMLAEESGRLGLVVYDDIGGFSNKMQFRLRRSHALKDYDVRQVLAMFSIANGGGHEGAIGFRFEPGEIDDLASFTSKIIDGIEESLKKVN